MSEKIVSPATLTIGIEQDEDLVSLNIEEARLLRDQLCELLGPPPSAIEVGMDPRHLDRAVQACVDKLLGPVRPIPAEYMARVHKPITPGPLDEQTRLTTEQLARPTGLAPRGALEGAFIKPGELVHAIAGPDAFGDGFLIKWGPTTLESVLRACAARLDAMGPRKYHDARICVENAIGSIAAIRREPEEIEAAPAADTGDPL